MITLLLAAQLVTAPPPPACKSVQPSPAFVCVDGGWLPPGHPNIPAPAATLPPTYPPPSTDPYAPRFRVGRRYVRGTAHVFISAAGQLPDGTPVLFAFCVQAGDGCFTPGYVRLFPIGANAADWNEQQP
jgi:hypothetical protein